MKSLGFSMYSTMSSANSEFYFFANLDPFHFFFFSDHSARTFKTVLYKTGESGHPCLVPELRGNAFSFSLLSVMLAVGLSYMTFIVLWYIPSVPIFWSFLFFLS